MAALPDRWAADAAAALIDALRVSQLYLVNDLVAGLLGGHDASQRQQVSSQLLATQPTAAEGHPEELEAARELWTRRFGAALAASWITADEIRQLTWRLAELAAQQPGSDDADSQHHAEAAPQPFGEADTSDEDDSPAYYESPAPGRSPPGTTFGDDDDDF